MSLIWVIYWAEAPETNKSSTSDTAEKPELEPFELSTILLGCPSPLFAKNNPSAFEVVNDG